MKAFLMLLLLFDMTSLSSIQKAEIRRIDERLLAPCCYTQSIEVHGSEIAGQMRAEVADMVAEGRTEEEIVNHYKAVYGERILIVPDGMTGRILFSLPVATSVLASLLLFVRFRRMLRCGIKEGNSNIEKSRLAVDHALREKIEREIGESW